MAALGSIFFGPGGRLSRILPAYEHRPGQEEMAVAVSRTLEDGGRLLVEAGTGVGKTLAYLVPALESGRRVIVSTGTRNLQDQIFGRELPFLRARGGYRFRATLMKGRDNYLCIRRFREFSREPLLEVREEAVWLEPLEEWSRATSTGDRAEIAELPDRLRLWRDVNARSDTCTGRKCDDFERCFLTRVKRSAQESDLVVVNHHLFFADLAVRSEFGAVLPDYDTVVFDEAHLLEEIATLYFGIQVSSGRLEELARDAEKAAAEAGAGATDGGGAAGLRLAAAEFWEPIRGALSGVAGRQRFAPPEDGGPELEARWAVLSEALSEVARLACGTGAGEGGDALERRAEDLLDSLDRLLDRRDPGYVYGMEMRGRRNVVLSAAPIDVSDLLRERLFAPLHASVLTSATLAVNGEFEFFRTRLGLESSETRIVPSPFDYARQALLYLPRGIPEPRQPDFHDRAAAEVRELLDITDGRAFLLFTSYAAMDRLRSALEADDRWRLFVQGDGSRAALVEGFRATPGAVLLGTTSFWHGVDVPGEALSLVVVDKLPFDVPTDPLVAARIEHIRQRGGHPFREYQTPMAVLELKQGLGRLLRRTSDRGLLAVLDPRIVTKSYGKTFLRSLPPYPKTRRLKDCREFFRNGTLPAVRSPS